MFKLNLGCGINKIDGYINIDMEKSVEPDLILDFTVFRLPYENESVEEVVIFHTIEHIQKRKHKNIISECSRVLCHSGKLIISYPNFWECATRWKNNSQGKREFWEATLYGRQLFPSDYHVCAIDPDELAELLISYGFRDIRHKQEKNENYNSVTCATKDAEVFTTYVDLLANDIESTIINRL